MRARGTGRVPENAGRTLTRDTACSVINRSWKVPTVLSTRPFAWGDRANIIRAPSSAMARPNWVGVPAGLILRPVFEDRMAVGVEGEGNAVASKKSLHQQQVVVAVLLLAEPGVDYSAGGVVHREEQRELRPVFPQPPVMAAVQLYQHALPGHPPWVTFSLTSRY